MLKTFAVLLFVFMMAAPPIWGFRGYPLWVAIVWSVAIGINQVATGWRTDSPLRVRVRDPELGVVDLGSTVAPRSGVFSSLIAAIVIAALSWCIPTFYIGYWIGRLLAPS